MRIAPAVVLSSEDRRALEAAVRARRASARSVERARIILLAADGWQDQMIALHLEVTPAKAARWRRRFLTEGLAALDRDAPRPGRPRTITVAHERAIVRKTTHQTPPHATHWSTRTMAAATGYSEKTIRRIWHRHGLKPHLTETFKLSRDPAFAEKVEAIVGLYLHPPAHAIVLCVDEKSQIQALDRTQPGLPLRPGRCGTMTHDYTRHGTATLFAALNTLDGSIISMCDDRHRHQEWLKFLRVIDHVTPKTKELYLIVDNAATHKHAKVQRWLARHPRFHVQYTPTSSSWLNMVERFFRDLTQRRLRRGAFHDVEDLITAIEGYVDQHNRQPKPFIWTATANDILAKVSRARAVLDKR